MMLGNGRVIRYFCAGRAGGRVEWSGAVNVYFCCWPAGVAVVGSVDLCLFAGARSIVPCQARMDERE